MNRINTPVDPIDRLGSDEDRRRKLGQALRFAAAKLEGEELRKLEITMKDVLRRFVPPSSNGHA